MNKQLDFPKNDKIASRDIKIIHINRAETLFQLTFELEPVSDPVFVILQEFNELLDQTKPHLLEAAQNNHGLHVAETLIDANYPGTAFGIVCFAKTVLSEPVKFVVLLRTYHYNSLNELNYRTPLLRPGVEWDWLKTKPASSLLTMTVKGLKTSRQASGLDLVLENQPEEIDIHPRGTWHFDIAFKNAKDFDAIRGCFKLRSRYAVQGLCLMRRNHHPGSRATDWKLCFTIGNSSKRKVTIDKPFMQLFCPKFNTSKIQELCSNLTVDDTKTRKIKHYCL